jgi:uncharacterized membrane protein YphA (DoxX/SURF4 family)
MFPSGAAGFSLIILRVCATISLLMITFNREQLMSPSWTFVGMGLLSLLMVIGALTPIASTVSALIEVFYLLHSHGADLGYTLVAIFVTVVLALLGPGAFSVDAKLFGRRLIIPDDTD